MFNVLQTLTTRSGFYQAWKKMMKKRIKLNKALATEKLALLILALSLR